MILSAPAFLHAEEAPRAAKEAVQTAQERLAEKQALLASKGTASFLIKVLPATDHKVDAAALAKAQRIIERRLNPDGAREISITATGPDKLSVEVPGLSGAEMEESVKTLEKMGLLEFRQVGPDGPQPSSSKDVPDDPPGHIRMLNRDRAENRKQTSGEPKSGEWVLVKDKAEITGKNVSKAFAASHPADTHYRIQVTLHKESGEKMRILSKASLGKPIAIVVDGEVLSTPVVREPFGDAFEITGSFTKSQATELASLLMNPLENPLKVEKTTLIPPSAMPKKP